MKRILAATMILVGVPGSALADGHTRLSPLGVPAPDVRTLRCQSGAVAQYFAPNTQSVRLLYRGQAYLLRALGEWPGQRYGEPLVLTPGGRAVPSKVNLVWRSTARSGDAAASSVLEQVHQLPGDAVTFTVLERCRG